jgi:hypothetical protein
MRVAVALGRACDNRCIFCAQEGLPREAASEADVQAALDRALASGARAVTFVGGEPALDPRLGAYVEKARAGGFSQVGIQTNGIALAASGAAGVGDLAARGLTDVHLSLHGAESRVHDWHTGVPGSFEAVLRTLGASRAANLEVAVVTLLTRSSFRVLSPIPRLLASRGAAAWCLDVPSWRGRAAAASDRVVPRLALALPFALHALDGAARVGLPAFVRGAPSCLLGPFAAAALDATARSFGEGCVRCASHPGCAGVDAEYLARFGGDELSSCPAVPRDPRHASLRAMFVGPGEMAPPSTLPVHPTPERARVALPMLGRPAPARAEVAASVPRQSGDALRTILPALFGDGAPAGRPEER